MKPSNTQTTVRPMLFADGADIIDIYREGIASGNATFRTEVPTWEEWDRTHLTSCRFVIDSENGILGWAALAKVSERAVYRGVAEISIYVKAGAQGMGLGGKLMGALIDGAENAGFWTLQARIFPENKGSVLLHNRFGFREVGLREKLGQLAGQWRDLLLLERRSKINGLS